MNLLPINIEQNKNFFYDERGFLCHYTGEFVGMPRYRFSVKSEQHHKECIVHDTIKVYSTGVLVEYDSNCYDVENERDSFNLNGGGDERRHYINKMFFNNNGEMVLNQQDYIKPATLIGQELVRLCDSSVTITDKGIEIKRENIATEFPALNNMIGDFKGSGERIKIDNSHNAKEQEFHTYEELNQALKLARETEAAQAKTSQENRLWGERHKERYAQVGFNNLTLKHPKSIEKLRTYKAYHAIKNDKGDLDPMQSDTCPF